MQSDKIVECHPKKIQNNKEYGLNVRKKKQTKIIGGREGTT